LRKSYILRQGEGDDSRWIRLCVVDVVKDIRDAGLIVRDGAHGALGDLRHGGDL
jgi:hypothetical protein